MEDLESFLMPYFENVYVFEIIYPDRHNFYFYASERGIPFKAGWRHGLRS